MEDRRIRRFGRRSGATLLTLGLALGGFSVFAPSAGAVQPANPGSQGQGQGQGQDQGQGNPNDGGGGNNGTVKVQGALLDDAESNANDPKVECPLTIVWEGFDTPERNTTVTVGEHKFNDGDTPLFQQAYSFTGGSFETTVTPDLTSATPSNTGDYHLDVIVDTALSVGQSITKTKVIWVDGSCAGGTTEEPQQSTATVEVHKAVSGTLPQGVTTFPFTVSCTTGTVDGGSMSLASGGSATATVTWDAGGTGPSCTVTEANARNANTTTYTVGNTPGTGLAASTGELTDASTIVVSFTNTYTGNGGCPGCSDGGIIPVVNVTPDVPVVDNPAPAIDTQVITPAPAQVAGEQIVAPAPAQSVVLGTELARTGAMTDRLIVAAGLCLLLGGLALVASKERTAVPTRRR